MARFRYLVVASVLGVAVSSWGADTVQSQPPPGAKPEATVQETGVKPKAAVKAAPNGLINEHAKKRREAKKRLLDNIETRKARVRSGEFSDASMNPGAGGAK